MQMRAQEQSPDSDADDFDDSSSIASNNSVEFSDDNDDNDIDFSADVKQLLSHPVEFGLDFYSSEGLDACRNNGYVTTTSPLEQFHPENVYSFGLSLSNLQSQMKLLSDAATAAHSDQQPGIINTSTTDDSPYVFLTDGTNNEPAIMRIVEQFTLNNAQQRAFRIIAYHTLGRSKVGPQL
jgi:hypothetical protein